VQDFVIDLRYGDASIPVVKDGDTYFLEIEAPDEPERIPVAEEDLHEYHVDVDQFFAVLASENAIELNPSEKDEGLWHLGVLNRDGTPYVVAFVPARISLGLVAAIERFRTRHPSRPIMLLVASEASILGVEHQLGRLNAVSILLEQALGEDLTIDMPMRRPAPDIDINIITQRARWRGVEMDVTDHDFIILVELALNPGSVVDKGDLCVAGDLSRGEQDVRKSIMHLRQAILRADASMDSEEAPEVVQSVRGIGYRLGLRPDQVRLHQVGQTASPA